MSKNNAEGNDIDDNSVKGEINHQKKESKGNIGVQAMNNNIFANMLNPGAVDKDTGDGDTYYAQESQRGDVPIDNPADINIDRKMVQFDTDNGEKGGRLNNVDKEEDYDNNVNEDQNEYHEEKDKSRHIQIGRKHMIPREDDTDYTYYQENHQHDDYVVKEDLEKDVKGKLKPVNEENISEDSSKLVNVDAPQLMSHERFGGSPHVTFIVVAVCMFVILLLMYRFIKSRRIHIRYNPRSFSRL